MTNSPKFIIADTHFEHSNILTFEPSRAEKMRACGYEDFDAMIIDTWNATVKEEDHVLHLGDVSFKEGFKRTQNLKGQISLVVGNHDRSKHLRYYKELGWDVIDSMRLDIPEGEAILKELNNTFSQKALHHKLLACWVMDLNGKRVMFSHFPVFDNNPYDIKYYGITQILEKIFVRANCELNIHGHTHSHGAKEPFCKSACLERNDFKLLAL
ncbi:metallophosphoesterase family protein [Sulfurospirillum sp. 1612]|uniref:metallophosphoesterase family protein n=1 Tax=Sulfurospirillum sp. 1612 TaxID=3094835 RepID=UPI002F94A43E